MSAAIPEGGFAVAVQAEIRRAFQQGEAMKALVLRKPDPVPAGAGLGVLILAATRTPDWRANCAEVTTAVNKRLDAAETLLRSYAEAIDHMRRIADHLRDGDPLPESLPAELALAAKMLAGTPEGLNAAAGIDAEQGASRRRLEALRGELARAKSAAAVACAKWAKDYVADLGLDPLALGLTEAWRSAVQNHNAVLTRYRAGQTEEAA